MVDTLSVAHEFDRRGINRDQPRCARQVRQGGQLAKDAHTTARIASTAPANDAARSTVRTRAALVVQVAEAADLTKKDADLVLETVLTNIVEALRRGRKSSSAASGASASDTATHAAAATRRPAAGWTCRQSASPTGTRRNPSRRRR